MLPKQPRTFHDCFIYVVLAVSVDVAFEVLTVLRFFSKMSLITLHTFAFLSSHFGHTCYLGLARGR